MIRSLMMMCIVQFLLHLFNGLLQIMVFLTKYKIFQILIRICIILKREREREGGWRRTMTLLVMMTVVQFVLHICIMASFRS